MNEYVRLKYDTNKRVESPLFAFISGTLNFPQSDFVMHVGVVNLYRRVSTDF